ncbi:MAG: hypothetical protein E5X53_06305 [Mesorhizobium sp.]|uniref:hypothetical protein n=1 Tax=Mesorhizobium sp. TaxID=1871066 RepID=UPI000FEA0B69|nr:hypothetical protein [Mesorhizobium sp.]RWM21310.1 MAG: hypothetical protein EOR73_12075 [Mesorhizobium sp.]TIP73716.1 MAG: hypothetical protein E5X55_12385 [Mesorhizobium sp.]TIQ12247.1 MAG: hypothetical protein E5X57_14335 [Mesorhizobium sp.]TIR53190.1 MAG: hypothetical protein E5X53_06305 [Mesorhizobium sp.]TJV99397.1 MAG: hypothetical protein E5X52_06090 [Mesorhizobium sp.]
MFLDGQLFSLGWTSRMYRWHKLLRQSIFLITGIYASDPSLHCGIPDVTKRHPGVTQCVIAAH